MYLAQWIKKAWEQEPKGGWPNSVRPPLTHRLDYCYRLYKDHCRLSGQSPLSFGKYLLQKL